jgi:hypothetical protein
VLQETESSPARGNDEPMHLKSASISTKVRFVLYREGSQNIYFKLTNAISKVTILILDIQDNWRGFRMVVRVLEY